MQRALRIPSVLHPLELLPLSSGLGSTIRGLSSRAEGGPSEQASTSAPDANGSQSSAASALPHQNAWKPDLPPRRVPVRQRIMNLRAKYYQHLFEDEVSSSYYNHYISSPVLLPFSFRRILSDRPLQPRRTCPLQGSQLLKLTRAEMRRQTQPKDATGSSKAAPSAPPAESVPKYTCVFFVFFLNVLSPFFSSLSSYGTHITLFIIIICHPQNE